MSLTVALCIVRFLAFRIVPIVVLVAVLLCERCAVVSTPTLPPHTQSILQLKHAPVRPAPPASGQAASLRRVNLAGLVNVTSLGDHFLASCVALTDVDFEPLAAVRAVGDGFFAGCVALRTVDVTPLAHARTNKQPFQGNRPGGVGTPYRLHPVNALSHPAPAR